MKASITVGAADYTDRRSPRGLLATARVRFVGGLLDGVYTRWSIYQGASPGEGLQVRAEGLIGLDESNPVAQAIVKAFDACEPRIEIDLDEPPAHLFDGCANLELRRHEQR